MQTTQAKQMICLNEDQILYWKHNGIHYAMTACLDEEPENPRASISNIAVMHFRKDSRCGLMSDADCEDFRQFLLKFLPDMTDDDYEAIQEQAKTELEARLKDTAYVFVIWLYDHSGVSLSLSRVDLWDSSWAGFAIVRRTDAEDRESAERIVLQELETYNQYLSRDCWTYQVLSYDGKPGQESYEDDWEFVDSRDGFYGQDIIANGAVETLSQDSGFIEDTGLWAAIENKSYRIGSIKSEVIVQRTFSIPAE